MKVGGIILIVLGCMNLFNGIFPPLFHQGDPSRIGQSITWGIAFTGIGIFLITRANKKKKEKEERERWNRGS